MSMFRTKETNGKRRWGWLQWLALLFGAWTLFSAVELSFQFITLTNLRDIIAKLSQGAREPPPVSTQIFWGLLANYLWAVATPFIVFCARRFPVERQNWWRGVLFHIPIGFLVATAHLAVYVCLYWGLDGFRANLLGSFSELFKFYFYRFLPTDLFVYSVIVVIVHAFDFYRKYREGELKASELRAQLAQAQLQALKMQLHPHFLFNTLNAISELVYKDREAAEQMITQLSDMLRLSLDKVGVQEVSLEQELDFLRKYLEIEQTRFQERLKVEMRIDPSALDASVPNMILQPIVENAVRHGIAPRATGGRIEICARREDGFLRLDVSDDGYGLSPQASVGAEAVGVRAAVGETSDAEVSDIDTSKGGLGLWNTRERLRRMYGASHRFELRSQPGLGLTVSLEIPFRENRGEQPFENPGLDS